MAGTSGFAVERFLEELGAWAAEMGRPATTLPYDQHPEQVADLRLPESDGPHPVAVLVHGGFWRARIGRSSLAAVAVDLTRRGWATWNVEYRRVGCGGGIPETLDDVAAAIEALDRVDVPSLDRSRILVLGHSAGGQLALWAAGGGKVSAALVLAGVCDLTEAANVGLGDGAAVEFAGGTPGERPGSYHAADPMRRLPTGVPQLLVHGSRDDRVPIEQSRRYERAAREAGDQCRLVELPGVDHFEVIDPRSQSWQTTLEHLASLGALSLLSPWCRPPAARARTRRQPR